MSRAAIVIVLGIAACHPVATPAGQTSTCDPVATPNYTPDPEKWDVSWLWTQLEPALDPEMPDAVKAETIARWVALSSVNDREVAADQGDGQRLRAIPFYGLCGERSVVTKQLAERAGLRAEMVSLYNFIEPGSGHTAVQFCYEDAWHYFDVTYAGIFVAEGRVLDFDEMREDPRRALDGLVPFETGFDLYQSEAEQPDEAAYRDRMLSYYSTRSIAETKSFSIYGSGEPVPLDVRFDLDTAPIVVGAPGATPTEVHWSGADQGISERMGVMLGHVVDNFQPTLIFENAEPGDTYTLSFYVRSMTSDGMTFTLEPSGVALLSDPLIVTSSTAVTEHGGHSIRFTPQRRTSSIAIEHDLPFGEGLVLDQIVLTRG